jgi:hypothetical protein
MASNLKDFPESKKQPLVYYGVQYDLLMCCNTPLWVLKDAGIPDRSDMGIECNKETT